MFTVNNLKFSKSMDYGPFLLFDLFFFQIMQTFRLNIFFFLKMLQLAFAPQMFFAS